MKTSLTIRRLPVDLTDQQYAALARLKDNIDFMELTAILHAANNAVGTRLRTQRDEVTFHVEQGAGQMLDEILETIDNASDMYKNRINSRYFKPMPL